MEKVINLCGILGIHTFGITLAIGFLLCNFLLRKHPLRSVLSEKHLENIILTIIPIGLLGAKLLFCLTTSDYSALFLNGGFSLLGAIISVLIYLALYASYFSLPILTILDLFALHTPLLQSIARLGCFYAGCCHGAISSTLFSVTYVHPSSLAPLNIPLHPTQLYSSLALISIYILLVKRFDLYHYKPGLPAMYYLMLTSLERFCIDFFRGDREYIFISDCFSIHQLLALLLFISSGIILFVIKKHNFFYKL